jgi:SAM-dependent methyltransferase
MYNLHMDIGNTEAQPNTNAGFTNEGWVITRGLKRKSGTVYTVDSEQYMDVLPTYKGKDLIKLLAEKTESGHAKILDIGGGAGLAALEIRDLYKSELLDITVIGHPQDTKQYLMDLPRNIGYHEPTEKKLLEKKIGFEYIDFTRLTEHDLEKLGKFDLITAVFSLTWMKQPKYELIKHVYNLLKNDGIALVGPLIIKFDGMSVFDYLNSQFGTDFDVNSDGVSFRKTVDKLPDIFQTRDIRDTVETVFLKE